MNKNIKELVSYIFIGGCTTLVNFVIYWFVIDVLKQGWLVANIISWVGAVNFAFWANKKYVFNSNNDTSKEAWQFFILRLATLLVETGLLFIFIQLIGVNEMISKVVVSVITVVSNYGLCKFKIFTSEGEYDYE